MCADRMLLLFLPTDLQASSCLGTKGLPEYWCCSSDGLYRPWFIHLRASRIFHRFFCHHANSRLFPPLRKYYCSLQQQQQQQPTHKKTKPLVANLFTHWLSCIQEQAVWSLSSVVVLPVSVHQYSGVQLLLFANLCGWMQSKMYNLDLNIKLYLLCN